MAGRHSSDPAHMMSRISYRLVLKSVAFYVVFVFAGLVLPVFLRSILA